MEKVVEILEQTMLYKEFLVNLPSPLNNGYFILLELAILMFCFISKVVDTVLMYKRHKKIVVSTEENNQIRSGAPVINIACFGNDFKVPEDVVAESVCLEEKDNYLIEQKESLFEAAMKEQKIKEEKRRKLFEKKEALRVKAEAMKEQL